MFPLLGLNVHRTDRGNPETRQGRSQPFCMEGFLMYIACPIDNRVPEALVIRGVPRKIFEFWVFRNGVFLILSTNFQELQRLT